MTTLKIKCKDFDKECLTFHEETYSHIFGKYIKGCGYSKNNGILEITTYFTPYVETGFTSWCSYKEKKTKKVPWNFEEMMKEVIDK